MTSRQYCFINLSWIPSTDNVTTRIRVLTNHLNQVINLINLPSHHKPSVAAKHSIDLKTTSPVIIEFIPMDYPSVFPIAPSTTVSTLTNRARYQLTISYCQSNGIIESFDFLTLGLSKLIIRLVLLPEVITTWMIATKPRKHVLPSRIFTISKHSSTRNHPIVPDRNVIVLQELHVRTTRQEPFELYYQRAIKHLFRSQ